MTESDLWKELKRRWHPHWCQRIEPAARRGGTAGFPDVLLLVGGELTPVELKLGTVRDGRIYPDLVKPAQVGWHYNLHMSGGLSWFLVAEDLEKCYMVFGALAPYWQDGWSCAGDALKRQAHDAWTTLEYWKKDDSNR